MICGPWRADLPPGTARVLAGNGFRSDWSKRWREIIRADPCTWCGAAGGTVDHIVPRSLCKGGRQKSWTNLTGSCAECNGRRGDAPVLQWLADPQAAAAAADAARPSEDPRRRLLWSLRRALIRRAWTISGSRRPDGRADNPAVDEHP